MDKQNYRVGSTPIRHNGRTFGVGEPVALAADEAKALQAHVTLDPVQADPPAPPVPAPAAEPAAEPSATETPAAAPAAEAPKADAKGKAKSGDKA